MSKELHLGGGQSIADGLPVYIEGAKRPYIIPPMSMLKVGEVMSIRKALGEGGGDAFLDAFYELVCHYVPRKYIDMLTLDELMQLSSAWTNLTGDEGESSASPTS